MRCVLLAVLVLSQVASAQALRNAIEKAKDRQDLRQDRRQLADDRWDAARAAKMLAEYDQAMAAKNVLKLGQLDGAFKLHLEREIAESKVESAQARQEVREDKAELRSDRRELRQDVALDRRPGVVIDDAKDKAKDRVDLADDRRDVVKERLSRERLQAIAAQLAGLAGKFDAGSVQAKRGLYAEVVGNALNEIARDKQEQREDRRELREDRKETREDRRDPLR